MPSKVPFIGATRANRPRNAFDLSQKHFFTSAPGMLLPVLALDLMAHDHVEINASDFMRAQGMDTNAMVSMRGVYEFFAVPYKQLFTAFDQFYTGMDDFRSSAILNLYSTADGTFDSRNLYIPSFKLLDVAQRIEDGTISSNDLFLGDNVNFNGYRLLDMLGYGKIYDSDGSVDQTIHESNNISCNPFRLAAYQKVYNDYYRNTVYEKADVKSYNLDSVVDLNSDYDVLSKLLTLRYRNANLDLLTNARPSYNYYSVDGMSGDVVIQNLEHYGLNQFAYRDLRGDAGDGEDSNDVVVNNLGVSIDSFGEQSDSKALLSLNTLRAAFAIDKLLDITNRAGRTFEEQMEAHFGVKVPKGRDGRCEFLGGFDSYFQTSDVTQTSGAGNDVSGYLGKISGKTVGSGSGRITFDATEPCVLLCIYSIVPDMPYDGFRIDPMVTKLQRFDYFTPEFENLGLQPYESRTFSLKSENMVVAYQPRYSEYKTALDVNHGEFVRGGSLSYWTSHRLKYPDGFMGLNTYHFKVDPRCLDDVFLVKFNHNPLTDPFFGGVNFNIVKVSDMSESGMPRV